MWMRQIRIYCNHFVAVTNYPYMDSHLNEAIQMTLGRSSIFGQPPLTSSLTEGDPWERMDECQQKKDEDEDDDDDDDDQCQL